MTSVTLKRAGGRGAGGSGLRSGRLGGTKIGSSVRRSSGFRTTFSSGTMFAPVPFVSVSRTQIVPTSPRIVAHANGVSRGRRARAGGMMRAHGRPPSGDGRDGGARRRARLRRRPGGRRVPRRVRHHALPVVRPAADLG